MKIDSMNRTHLTYCTSVHPARTLAQVYANIGTFVLAVKYKVCPDRPFGVGLSLSEPAASELACPKTLCAFRDFLAERGLYVFTLTGDGPSDWSSSAGLEHADRLALILAALLPAGVGGTLGTLPRAARRRTRRADSSLIARRLLEHVAILDRVRDVTGKDMCLAVQAAPSGLLQSAEGSVDFFKDRLYARRAVSFYRALTGLSAGRAEESLRRHVGVCVDSCHLALEYEEPSDALEAFDLAGVKLAKVRLGAGLQVDWRGGRARGLDDLRRLARIARFSHVVENRRGRLRRFEGLSQALQAEDSEAARTWRVHFHALLAQPKVGDLSGTQSEVEELLRLLRVRGDVHLEVEPRSWRVLSLDRPGGVVDTLCEELRWVLARLS